MSTYPVFLVRIHCITYNHAPYIEDAMNGFCMQQTTFPFVATIIDDASTDGEPDVIKKYLNSHFDMSNSCQWETDDAHFIFAQHKWNKNCYFAVVLLKYNYHQIKKDKKPLIEEWSNTKYVALCEGDDYWIMPGKLEKQVTFLENDSNYSMCFHGTNLINNSQIVGNDLRSNSECDYNVEEIVIGGGDFCSTCSMVIRRYILNQNYIFKKIAEVGDYPLAIICALEGKVHYFSEILGSYRVASVGSWTQNVFSDKKLLFRYVRNEISYLQELDYETNFKYQHAIYCRLTLLCFRYLEDTFLTKQEFLFFLDHIQYRKLDKKLRIFFIDIVLFIKYPRVYQLKQYRNFLSLVYFLSPYLYNTFIRWRIKCKSIKQKTS